MKIKYLLKLIFSFIFLHQTYASTYISVDEVINDEEFFRLTCAKPEAKYVDMRELSRKQKDVITRATGNADELGQLGERYVSELFKTFKWECEYADSGKRAPTVFMEECKFKYGNNNGLDHVFFFVEEDREDKNQIDKKWIESKGDTIKKYHPLIIIHESKFQKGGGKPNFNGEGCKASCSKEEDKPCPQMSWRWVAHAIKKVLKSHHPHDCMGLYRHVSSNIFDSEKRITHIIRTASVLDAAGKISFFAVGKAVKGEEIEQSTKVLQYILRNIK